MKSRCIVCLLLALCWSSCAVVTAEPRLRVSDNQRYLVHADGTPFFYLGDTAWELFHRLDREEATAISRIGPPRGSP